jgi:hypothetical protein
MTFDMALVALRAGASISRQANTWLVLVPASTIVVEADRPLGRALPGMIGQSIEYSAHIDIRTKKGIRHEVMPWTPSQADLLANDWVIV